MSDAIGELLSRFVTVFGEPKTDDVDGFFREYEKALSGFHPKVIGHTADAVIKSATFWPRPAEIVKKAEEVAAILFPPKPWRDRDAEFRREPTAEEKARVRAMLKEFFAEQVTVSETPRGMPKGWVDVSRPAFEKMQRESPNAGLHRLSSTSRRMTGERDE